MLDLMANFNVRLDLVVRSVRNAHGNLEQRSSNYISRGQCCCSNYYWTATLSLLRQDYLHLTRRTLFTILCQPMPRHESEKEVE
jgi:hypothetical protein